MEPQLEGSRTEPSRAERSRMEPNTGRSFGVGGRRPSGVELSRVDPSAAEWSRNRGDAVGLGPQPERSRIETSRAEKSRVEPNSGQCCGRAEPRCKVCKAHVQSTQKPRAKAGPSCKVGPLVPSCKAQEGLVQTAAPPHFAGGIVVQSEQSPRARRAKPSCKRRGRGANACKGGGGGCCSKAGPSCKTLVQRGSGRATRARLLCEVCTTLVQGVQISPPPQIYAFFRPEVEQPPLP